MAPWLPAKIGAAPAAADRWQGALVPWAFAAVCLPRIAVARGAVVSDWTQTLQERSRRLAGLGGCL